MVYKVVVTKDAEEDLDSFIRYLLFEKKNEQAFIDKIFHDLQDYEGRMI